MPKSGNEKPEREPVLPPEPIGGEPEPEAKEVPAIESTTKADNTRKLYQSMKTSIRFYSASIENGKEELQKLREKMNKIQEKYDILETHVADMGYDMDALEKSFDALCLEHGLLNDLFPEQPRLPMEDDEDA